MYITSYLSKDVKPGKVTSSTDDLLQMVREMKLTHLPLFKGLDFIGNIAEEDLIEFAKQEKGEDIVDYAESFYLLEDQTIFDALQLIYHNHTNVLPVLSKDLKYIGIITSQTLAEALAKYPFIKEIAVSMLVSIATKDLSFSTISNIIESNNGKIYSLFIIKELDGNTEVLIRFNTTNLIGIGETFERYGFKVIQKYYNDEKQELLQSRYNQLLKYMNT